MSSNLPGVLSISETSSISGGKIACKKQADLSSQGKCHRRATTIDMIVDDALLQIFDFCLKTHYNQPQWNGPIWNWLPLVHVCRRWRQIMFDSPRRLNLRILCTYGTPVKKNLSIWPDCPIDLRLSPKSYRDLKPGEEDNAIAALEHRDRVNTIRLSTTGSQIGKLAASMQEPFPVLTHLNIRSWDEDDPLLTAEFLGGSAPRLQDLTLFRISFPALPMLLLSTSDIVTLNLLSIPTTGYISPERMVACLASLPMLKVLAIVYQDVASRPRRIRPPPVERSVLPGLTEFKFEGAFEYLEDLIAPIDSPRLKCLSTYYLNQPDDFQVTQLSEFIDRSIGPDLTSSRHAHVRFHCSEVVITLSHKHPQASHPGFNRRARVSLESYDWDLPDVAQVLSEFSAAHCTVHLELHGEFEETCPSDYAYDIEWLHLFRQFPAMRTLYVSLELGEAVCSALEDLTAETLPEVLPSLGLICLEGELASYCQKIVAIRRFSDHPITVVETKDEFDERVESYDVR